MRLTPRISVYTHAFHTLSEWSISVLLVLSVLWRGGKSLEMTWLLGGVAVLVTTFAAIDFFRKKKLTETVAKDEQRAGIPKLLWALGLLYIIWTLCSYGFSTTQNYGLDEVVRTTSLMLIFFWAYRKTASGEEGMKTIERMSMLFAVAIIIACVIGFMVYWLQPVDRFVGTFFDHRFHTDYWPNAWAELLLLGGPIVLYLALHHDDKDQERIGGRFNLLIKAIMVGLVFAAFFLSYSRASVIAFIVQGVLWSSVALLRRGKDINMRKVVPFAAVVAGVCLSVFFIANSVRSMRYDVQDVSDKVTFTAAEGTSSVSERAQFWQQAATLTVEKPLFGWGPYSFRFVQPRLQQHILATSDHPHNVFLKVAMERGIPAVLILIALLGYIYWKAGMHIFASTGNGPSELFSLPVLLLIGITGVLIHNLVDYNLQFVGIALPLWLFLGAIAGSSITEAVSMDDRVFNRATELGVAVALAIVLLWEGAYLGISSLGRHAEARGDIQSAMKYYNLSRGEWFSRDLYLSKANVLLEALRPGAAADELHLYRTVNTEDYRPLFSLATIEPDLDRAIAYYKEAYKRGKYNDLRILEGLVRINRDMANTQYIDEHKLEFDEILTKYADAILQNSHFIALSPNVESFIAISNILAQLYPDEEPRYVGTAAKVDFHAQNERSRIESRAPGFLW